jgi:hypothetical protein
MQIAGDAGSDLFIYMDTVSLWPFEPCRYLVVGKDHITPEHNIATYDEIRTVIEKADSQRVDGIEAVTHLFGLQPWGLQEEFNALLGQYFRHFRLRFGRAVLR